MQKKAKYELPETALVYEKSMKKAQEPATPIWEISQKQCNVAHEIIDDYQDRSKEAKAKKEKELLLEKADLIRHLLKHYRVIE